MPNVTVFSLQQNKETQTALAARFTGVFVEHANCSAEAVQIFFLPVSPENYFVGGKHTKEVFLVVNVEWYARPDDMQEAVAFALNEAVVEITNVPPKFVEINFFELQPANHFEGGKRTPVVK